MYFRDKLFLHSLECNFCVYFHCCCATWEMNTKITLLWVHKHFATRVHMLFCINHVIKRFHCMYRHHMDIVISLIGRNVVSETLINNCSRLKSVRCSTLSVTCTFMSPVMLPGFVFTVHFSAGLPALYSHGLMCMISLCLYIYHCILYVDNSFFSFVVVQTIPDIGFYESLP